MGTLTWGPQDSFPCGGSVERTHFLACSGHRLRKTIHTPWWVAQHHSDLSASHLFTSSPKAACSLFSLWPSHLPLEGPWWWLAYTTYSTRLKILNHICKVLFYHVRSHMHRPQGFGCEQHWGHYLAYQSHLNWSGRLTFWKLSWNFTRIYRKVSIFSFFH